MTQEAIPQYLDLLDAQRERVFAALDGLSEADIWRRPAPKEWSIGEILSHTARFFDSFQPLLQLTWRLLGWYGRLRRSRAYDTAIENVYQRSNFPMWTGFLWKPRHTPENPVPLAVLRAEIEAVHGKTRAFYTGKDEDVLGNIHAWDPAIGVVNLITGLKVCIDHDALHYDDVHRMVEAGGERESQKNAELKTRS
jgi:hypothetical protein